MQLLIVNSAYTTYIHNGCYICCNVWVYFTYQELLFKEHRRQNKVVIFLPAISSLTHSHPPSVNIITQRKQECCLKNNVMFMELSISGVVYKLCSRSVINMYF